MMRVRAHDTRPVRFANWRDSRRRRIRFAGVTNAPNGCPTGDRLSELEREPEGPIRPADAQRILLKPETAEVRAGPFGEEVGVVDARRFVERARGVLIEDVEVQPETDRDLRSDRAPDRK